jgi:hypothetical protein
VAGQAASSLGDAVFTVPAVLWMARDAAAGRLWAAAAVSGVPAAAYAAVALAGPLAGVAVDRSGRRTVMAATELARAALAGALAAVSLVPAGRLPAGAWLAALYLTVSGLNGAGMFFVPARTAVIAAIMPGEADRAQAAGLAEAAAAGCIVRAAGSRAVTCTGLFTAGALTAGYALARDVPAGLALLAGYGAAIGVFNTSVTPFLMGSAPGGYLGRVLAVFGPVNHAAAVSVLTAGWLASGALARLPRRDHRPGQPAAAHRRRPDHRGLRPRRRGPPAVPAAPARKPR